MTDPFANQRTERAGWVLQAPLSRITETVIRCQVMGAVSGFENGVVWVPHDQWGWARPVPAALIANLCP